MEVVTHRRAAQPALRLKINRRQLLDVKHQQPDQRRRNQQQHHRRDFLGPAPAARRGNQRAAEADAQDERNEHDGKRLQRRAENQGQAAGRQDFQTHRNRARHRHQHAAPAENFGDGLGTTGFRLRRGGLLIQE